MALGQFQGGNIIYLHIIDGKIARKVAPGTPGATQRQNKNGQIMHEVFFQFVSGKITGMGIRDTDFGKQFWINLDDSGETYQLSFPVESRYFDNFVSRAGNIDFNLPVSLSPYSLIDEQTQKKRSGFTIRQGKDKLEYFITKENQPEGFPPLKENAKDSEFKIWCIEKREWQISYILKMAEPLNVAKALSAPLDAAPNITQKDFTEDEDFGNLGDDEVPF